MTVSAHVPGAGDLIWTDFDPTRGREQAGRRPALVVSSAAFTEHTGRAIVCPITSRGRPFPTKCRTLTKAADLWRDTDQPYPQHRHDGPAHPLCGCRSAAADRTTRPREAEHLHYDLTNQIVSQ